jgi:hypothetical protein
MNRAERIKYIEARQAAIGDWFERATAFTKRVNSSLEKAFPDIEQVPEIAIGRSDELRKLSVEIPPTDQHRKSEFCEVAIKLFARKLASLYGDTFTFGRDRSEEDLNLFVLRFLSNGDLAGVKVVVSIDGNLAIFSLRYFAYNKPRYGSILPASRALERVTYSEAARYSQYHDAHAPYFPGGLGMVVGLVFAASGFVLGAWTIMSLFRHFKIVDYSRFRGDIVFEYYDETILVTAVIFSVVFLALYMTGFYYLKSRPTRDRIATDRLLAEIEGEGQLLSPFLAPVEYLNSKDHQIFIERILGSLDLVTAKLAELRRGF